MSSSSPKAATLSCVDHPGTAALAGCQSCRRALCDACFRFRMNGRPACARCAYETATRPERRVSLAAAFLGFAWGGGLWLARRYDLWESEPFPIGLGAVVAPVIAYFIAASARDPARPEIENRDPGEGEVTEDAFAGRSPYRAYARRAILAVSPRVSGKATALVVGASLAASAVVLPMSLKLPRWIEAEIVLAAFWLIVAATLIVLLYRGFRLRDDFVYFLPWNRPSAESERSKKGARSSGGSGKLGLPDGCAMDGCADVGGEGCFGVLAVGLAIALAFGAAWVFIELAMPLVFFLM